MLEACEREIDELHRFFEDWFNGKLDHTEGAWARLSGVLADGFEIISPDGHRVGRTELLHGLWEAHGTWRAAGDAARIWTKGFRARALDYGIVLATYEEWQERQGETLGRLSSALLRHREGTPNGVEWLHVHETWLADDAGES